MLEDRLTALATSTVQSSTMQLFWDTSPSLTDNLNADMRQDTSIRRVAITTNAALFDMTTTTSYISSRQLRWRTEAYEEGRRGHHLAPKAGFKLNDHMDLWLKGAEWI
ncbi:hypothetical protein HAX54_044614 [Datura stramonium]|uniref:Uncharacterized protein n=1 Tax=Datura stramonium TaxID=4076 RepID=A0ABS8SPP2_DATST|nr:hypothetical protein [Datura stramonium]